MASPWCEQSLDSFRLLSWKMSEKDHIASLYCWVSAAFCMRNSLEQTFSLSLLLKKLQSRLKYYLLYIVKTTRGLILKKTFDMFLQTLRILFGIFVCLVVTARACWFLNIPPYGWRVILNIKIIFMEQQEHLCNWESRECKHPKIKGKRYILLLFWLSWQIYSAASCLMFCLLRKMSLHKHLACFRQKVWNLTPQVD